MTHRTPDLYDAIGIMAMIVTPLAAAILFGWELYTHLLSTAVPAALAIVGGVAGALAIESVGVYSGHVGMEAAARRDARGWVAALAMAVYVAFGWSKVPGYGMIFVIAALIYALVAIRHSMSTAVDAAAEKAHDTQAWERELRREEMRLRHEERLAKIAATSRQDARQDSGNIAATSPAQNGNIPADWRQLTPHQRHELAHLTREQRAALMPQLSERAARDWHRRLDEVAAQNGSYVG